MPPTPKTNFTRCGYVALIGATNAGKSTFLNQAAGEKLSIVTHKVQTTRGIVRGIVNQAETTQIIFMDTPGIFKPRNALGQAMLKAAWSATREADAISLIVDANRGLSKSVQNIARRLQNHSQPKILILNKTDLVANEKLLSLSQTLNNMLTFDATFMISAQNGDKINDVMDALAQRMPEGPWLYPKGQTSDNSIWRQAAEITREKLFLRLHDELPYSITIETTQWQKLKDGSARVEQIIYVEHPNHKKMVIGANGRAIRAISMQARRELATICGYPIHLFLFVKVRENWQKDPERFKEMGLKQPSSK